MKVAILFLILTTLFMSVGMYLWKFGVDFDNANFQDWVNVATYFNNLFSPLFLAVSSILIYKTWSTSKDMLQLSKDELGKTYSSLKEQEKISRMQLDLNVFRNKLNNLDRLLQNEVVEYSCFRAIRLLNKVLVENQADFPLVQYLNKEIEERFPFSGIVICNPTLVGEELLPVLTKLLSREKIYLFDVFNCVRYFELGFNESLIFDRSLLQTNVFLELPPYIALNEKIHYSSSPDFKRLKRVVFNIHHFMNKYDCDFKVVLEEELSALVDLEAFYAFYECFKN